MNNKTAQPAPEQPAQVEQPAPAKKKSPTARTHTNLVWERIHDAYDLLPVKGEAIILTTMNMALLKPILDVASAARTKAFETRLGKGCVQVSPAHNHFDEIMKDKELINQTEIEVDGLEKLFKDDLKVPEVPSDKLAGGMALLVQHGLLDLKKKRKED